MRWLLLFALAAPLAAQFPLTPAQATRLTYTEMSPPMSERFLLRQARGVVEGREGAPIARVQLGIYTEAAPHRLLAATVTDDQGRFKFELKLPSGDYRLIALYPGLCSANVPLRLDPHAGNRHHLVLTLEYPGLDLCARAAAK